MIRILFVIYLFLSIQMFALYSDSLTVRNAHAMAFDSDNGSVILFGGADEDKVYGDLWSWDGKKWKCLAKGDPPPRTFPAMVYDTERKQLLLFGGNRVLFGTEKDTNSFLDDMWIWNNNSWQEITVNGPSARAEAGIAYDSYRKRTVLFGGYRNVNGERIRLGDTWEWDGKKWEQLSSVGPKGRNGAAMAYDPIRKKIVLFGGGGAPDETWEWDGKDWTQIKSAKTEGRFNSAMAYDLKRGELIRFGGWTREGRVGDTWKFDGEQWIKLNTKAGPSPRNHTAIVYDSKRGVLVLFGGHDGDRVFGDTWEWDGEIWSQVENVEPRFRINNGH